MASVLRAGLRAAALAVVLAFGASPASAHDCASQQDCAETTGYVGGIATIGGIIAILTGVLGSQLGGAVGTGGAAPAGTAAGTPTPPKTGVAAPEPREEEPVAVGPPVPAEEPGDDEWEIPWDEILAATEPTVDEMPFGEDTGTEDDTEVEDTGGDEEWEIPWDEIIAATEPPADAPDEMPVDELEQEPVDEEEPAEDEEEPAEAEPEQEAEQEPEEEEEPEAEESTTPKPPLLETAETIGGIAGNVKDGVDRAKKELEGLPIDEATRKEIADKLDEIGEKAEQLKEGADKAAEYINVLDENLQRTDKLGITPDSQNFLGWWRVTFRAAGELTQKFVDGVFAPVKKLLGEKLGEKAEEVFHQAVPVKEFGDELSKLPTSAAEHVVNASQRDQIGENVGLVPKGDPGYMELDDLFPGRKWP